MKIKLLHFAILFFYQMAFSQLPDPGFGNNGLVTSNFGQASISKGITSLALQDDGKIVASGFYYPNATGGNNEISLVRYNTDGSIDSSFGENGSTLLPIGLMGSGTPSMVRIQTNGKIIVFATAANHNLAILRLNSDGSPDSTFGDLGTVTITFGTGFQLSAYSLELQTDDKIVIASSLVAGQNQDILVGRLNADGSIDEFFGNMGYASINFGMAVDGFSETSDNAHVVKIQQDGKILVGGLTTYDPESFNSTDFALLRLNSDGSLDSSFGVEGKTSTDFGGFDSITSIMINAAGKIIATGGSTSTNGQGQVAIAQYESNGNLDSGYGIGGKALIDFDANAGRGTAVLQSDGKLVISGGIPDSGYENLAGLRLNTDGSADTTFGTNGIVQADFGPNTYDYALYSLIQPDGKLLLGGEKIEAVSDGGTDPVATFNFALARYSLEDLSSPSFMRTSISFSPNPFNDYIDLNLDAGSAGNITVDLLDLNGRVILSSLVNEQIGAGPYSKRIAMPAGLPNGIYLLRISNGISVSNFKIVK
jgi:uncharacterized delta-60 repeat protein